MPTPKPEPNTLKILLIIPFSTSQKNLSIILILLPIVPILFFLFYCFVY